MIPPEIYTHMEGSRKGKALSSDCRDGPFSGTAATQAKWNGFIARGRTHPFSHRFNDVPWSWGLWLSLCPGFATMFCHVSCFCARLHRDYVVLFCTDFNDVPDMTVGCAEPTRFPLSFITDLKASARGKVLRTQTDLVGKYQPLLFTMYSYPCRM
jgi:hypothetical protein